MPTGTVRRDPVRRDRSILLVLLISIDWSKQIDKVDVLGPHSLRPLFRCQRALQPLVAARMRIPESLEGDLMGTVDPFAVRSCASSDCLTYGLSLALSSRFAGFSEVSPSACLGGLVRVAGATRGEPRQPSPPPPIELTSRPSQRPWCLDPDGPHPLANSDPVPEDHQAMLSLSVAQQDGRPIE